MLNLLSIWLINTLLKFILDLRKYSQSFGKGLVSPNTILIGLKDKFYCEMSLFARLSLEQLQCT